MACGQRRLRRGEHRERIGHSGKWEGPGAAGEEPGFCLTGPAAALACPSIRPCGCGSRDRLAKGEMNGGGTPPFSKLTSIAMSGQESRDPSPAGVWVRKPGPLGQRRNERRRNSALLQTDVD